MLLLYRYSNGFFNVLLVIITCIVASLHVAFMVFDFFQKLKKSYHVKKSDQNQNTGLKEVVKGVSFMVEEGEVFGLLG